MMTGTDLVLRAQRKQVYLVGGESTCGQFESAVEMYDAVSGRWSQVKEMSSRRVGCAAVWQQNSIFVMGGMDAHKHTLASLNTVEHYDPRVGRWARTTHMLRPR